MDLRQLAIDYLEANPHFTEGTRKKFGCSVNRWQRGTGELKATLQEGDFIRFRRAMLDKGLSPHSIEQTCYDVKKLAEFAGYQVSSGRALRKPPPSPSVPELSAIGKVYAATNIAKWPRIERPADWWKGFLGLGLITAFRLQDLLKIRWSQLKDGWMIATPQKTKKFGVVQEIPIWPVQHILDRTPVLRAEVLHSKKSMKQLRNELERICLSAGVVYFTPHDIRRAGITMWSIAHPEAGRIIHGCGRRDVMKHYLSPRKILESAADKLRLPQEMVAPDTRNEQERQEEEILTRLKNASDEQRQLLLSMTRQFG